MTPIDKYPTNSFFSQAKDTSVLFFVKYYEIGGM